MTEDDSVDISFFFMDVKFIVSVMNVDWISVYGWSRRSKMVCEHEIRPWDVN